MDKKYKILVVEDEDAIRLGLEDVLIFKGYDIASTGNGREGLKMALSGQFDLILLDVMLPEINGFDICKEIRLTDKEQAVILLTAKSQDEDIINGLTLGADDYIAKPFSIAQLLLRVEAVLRRTTRKNGIQDQIIHIGDIAIDTVNLTCIKSDKKFELTRKEVDLFEYLFNNSTRPVSRIELLHKVWGYPRGSDIETRTVDIHIAKLRRKIESDSQQPKYLITIRGEGYRMVVEQ